jgi:ubiquinone/menaquinone biosynthesis C-methylase UbiE
MGKGRESGMPDEAYWQTFFNPECVVAKLSCAGKDVVEFGCGYGLFTVPAAKLVTGNVYALDIEPAMVFATANHARGLGCSNVVVEQRDFLEDGCGRPDSSADYAMLFNILHIEESELLLREAYRVLAPGGKAGIIHWKTDSATPRGPSMAIRPSREHCQRLAEKAGFRFVRNEELCCCSWHWGLVVEKPPPDQPCPSK